VISSFRNRGTQDIFNNRDTKAARRTCPASIWPVAKRKLARLVEAERLADLRGRGIDLHLLTRGRVGQHAIRINAAYRICFRWTRSGAEDVEITNYH
jgi:proteic killer suppression protein